MIIKRLIAFVLFLAAGALVQAATVNCTLNPYSKVDWGTVNQYKAHYHTHTTQSDGQHSVAAVIDFYHDADYDILSITDHNKATWPWTNWNRDPAALGMLAVRGDEYSNSHHMNAFHDFTTTSTTLENGLPHVQSQGGLVQINHPGRYKTPDQWSWYIDWYKNYSACVSMEVLRRGNSYPDDLKLWDNINENLYPQSGKLVWGTSNDDMHRDYELFGNFQFMLMPELTDAAHRECMTDGAYYFCIEPGETGTANVPRISEITVDDDAKTISITGSGYDNITWIGSGTTTVGSGATFDYSNYTDQPFVRAILDGPNGDSYTQPFGFTTDTASAIQIPATIEAEDFVDAYDSDTSFDGDSAVQSSVNPYVDIQYTGDSAGGVANVGWTDSGEWLEYSIDAGPSGGTYDITLRLASRDPGKSVEVLLDGSSVGSADALGEGWQVYSDRTLSGVAIGSGPHTLRVHMTTGRVNLNYVTVVEVAADTEPPTPNPATFAVAPAADSDSAISMTATTGSDASGPVEYYFTETSGNAGGTDSGWQTSASYTDTDLSASTLYTYTVTMRDALGNTGMASSPASATTDDAPIGGESLQIVDFTPLESLQTARASDVDTDSGDSWTFSDTTPLVSSAGGTNDVIYGGLTTSWAAGQDYNPGLLHIGWNGGGFQLQINPADKTLNTAQGIYVWNKEDFLIGSSESVSLEVGNSMSFDTSWIAANSREVRFVVKQAGAYYVSEYSVTSGGSGTLADVSTTQWAPLNTTDYTYGSFGSLALDNVQAVGLYYNIERTGYQAAFRLTDFQVQATVGIIETDVGVLIDAVNYDAESHPSNDNIIWDRGTKIGYIKGGSWVEYLNFDFGTIGAETITVSAASGTTGGTLEVWIDDPVNGEQIATVNITSTGGWNTFTDFTAPVSAVSGEHPLFLVFVNSNNLNTGLFAVQSFQFD